MDMQTVRYHHADAPCNPSVSENCFLLSEVERLSAELAAYRHAFSGMWVEPDGMIWVHNPQRPEHPRALLVRVESKHLYDALASFLPTGAPEISSAHKA